MATSPLQKVSDKATYSLHICSCFVQKVYLPLSMQMPVITRSVGFLFVGVVQSLPTSSLPTIASSFAKPVPRNALTLSKSLNAMKNLLGRILTLTGQLSSSAQTLHQKQGRVSCIFLAQCKTPDIANTLAFHPL